MVTLQQTQHDCIVHGRGGGAKPQQPHMATASLSKPLCVRPETNGIPYERKVGKT